MGRQVKRAIVFCWSESDRLPLDISENDNNPPIPRGYKLVQQFNENTANQICEEINKQLIKAFKWLEKFENMEVY